VSNTGKQVRKGWCSVCGGVWCDWHDCCSLDCAYKMHPIEPSKKKSKS